MPAGLVALIPALKTILKDLGKGAWGYAKRTLLTFWENKYILIIAGLASGLFIYYYNMLYSWFAFPPLLNIAVLGIFALINFAGVVSYGKSVPEGGGNSQGPSVSTGN